MAAELQPPEAPTSAAPTVSAAPTPTPPPPPPPPPSSPPPATLAQPSHPSSAAPATTITAQPPAENPPPPLAPKRQRRPSVRLGEIGDQPATLFYDSSHLRRAKHPWRHPKDSSKTVRARSLTHLVNGSDTHDLQENEDRNPDGDGIFEFANRKAKAKRATTAKRPRTNWVSRVEDGGEAENREFGDEGFRDFDPDSHSPMKDQSPVHSVDNVPLDLWHGHRRSGRARVAEMRENDAVEQETNNNNPESDSRERKCGTSDGVISWLIELGLSRYAPLFEIHEVDDQVLPMLTLEDLKDMGINAVGSRRKMYAAIQKLRKGFS